MDENLSSGEYEIKICNINEDESSNYEESLSSEIYEVANENGDGDSKCNVKLRKRIKSLKKSILHLKNQLKEERELWKREVEETLRISSRSKSQTTISETDSENKTSDSDNFSVSEYENKLLHYQEALKQAQQENRTSLQRQIAISNYKRRLLEVENMCNLELLRVKQSVQFLQPLQMMLTEWNASIENMPDMTKLNPLDDKLQNVNNEENKISELVLPLEIFGNKLQTDMNEIITKLSSKTFANAPQLTAATSTIWQTDDTYAHAQSTLWFAECQTKFN